MTTPIRIGVIGTGKIACDQHMPAIAASPDFTLAATVSPSDVGTPGAPHFDSLQALLEARLGLDAVVLCTPPQVRYGLALQAMRRGLHVFLEKPPGATLSEVEVLRSLAGDRGVSLFAGWHSRYAGGVDEARSLLARYAPLSARIVWREDVRVWHPGQAWIWAAGGLGVFDPGINALSILTHIWPGRLSLRTATLSIPANREAPIAARLQLRCVKDCAVDVDFDWRQTGEQIWTITVETAAGPLIISAGGGRLAFRDTVRTHADAEYARLYQRFADLIHAGESDVDAQPLQLAADAFFRGERIVVEPFVDTPHAPVNSSSEMAA